MARLMKALEAGAFVLNCLILGACESNGNSIPTAFTALKNDSCICLSIEMLWASVLRVFRRGSRTIVMIRL